MNLRSIWRRCRTATAITAAALLGYLAGIAGPGHGGAHLALAQVNSNYGPLTELGRVMVFIENQYVDPIERQRLLDGAVDGMVSELDPHSDYMDPAEFKRFNEDNNGSFAGIGVEVDFRRERVTIVAPIEGSPAEKAGLKSGDVIVAVDKRPLQGMAVSEIIKLMRGAPKTSVTLSIVRRGIDNALNITVVRDRIHVVSARSKRLTENIGYLRLRQFQRGSHKELLAAIAQLRKASAEPLEGLVFDMRSNPGGLVDEAEAIADEFLNGGVIFTTRHRGKITETASAHAGGAFIKGPIALLVNEYSASSTELVAGALRDHHRAVVIGAQTFGKGSVQTIFGLPGGSGLRLTTMRYYTPGGHAIQAAGIIPQIKITYENDDTALFVRENDLSGHLSAEETATVKTQRVVAAKERPTRIVTKDVPLDPRKGSDDALRVAFETVVQMRAR